MGLLIYWIYWNQWFIDLPPKYGDSSSHTKRVSQTPSYMVVSKRPGRKL